MELGIIGLPQSGKTTLFNALTRGDVPTEISGGRVEVHTAVIDVSDPRVDALTDLYKPKKVVHAKVTYADIAGLEVKAAQGGIAGPLLNTLAQMDGFIHVVRDFTNPSVPHIGGSIDPRRDLANMEAELILNDMILVERKLQRLDEERKRGGIGRDKGVVERETALFERISSLLSDEVPLRNETFSEEEEKMLRGFQFLTLKPLLIVINISEADLTSGADEVFEKKFEIFVHSFACGRSDCAHRTVFGFFCRTGILVPVNYQLRIAEMHVSFGIMLIGHKNQNECQN